MQIQGIVIFAKDVARMSRFYGEVLGLPRIVETETAGWVEFRAGGATLALHAIPQEIADTIHLTEPPEPRMDTPLKVIFRVSDVAAERDRLVEQGVLMLPMRPWDACDGLDPEGNVFQITRG